MTGAIATVQHAREIQYCVTGLRAWFRGRDVSFEEFLNNGVPSAWLRQQDDHMATVLAEYAEAQWAARAVA